MGIISEAVVLKHNSDGVGDNSIIEGNRISQCGIGLNVYSVSKISENILIQNEKAIRIGNKEKARHHR